MASAYCIRLAKIAEEQHRTFQFVLETDEPLRSQIKRYWTGIDDFPGVGTAWSAVFVSWCVKQAGATAAEFEFAQGHARFVHKAIENASRNVGVFRGFDVTAAKPEVGDLIHNNRGRKTYDFAYAAAHDRYLSHSAIVVETGTDTLGLYALTIGGNESDSIRRVRVPLTAAGFIKQRDVDPYISLIKTLK